jgi:hypothetical protein
MHVYHGSPVSLIQLHTFLHQQFPDSSFHKLVYFICMCLKHLLKYNYIMISTWSTYIHSNRSVRAINIHPHNHTYLQQMVKQYWIVQRPVKLSFSPRFMLELHWLVTFRISIRASIKSGYFSLSGVPRMKLQACKNEPLLRNKLNVW